MAIHDAMSYLEEILPQVRMELSNIQVVVCTSDLASLQPLGHPRPTGYHASSPSIGPPRVYKFSCVTPKEEFESARLSQRTRLLDAALPGSITEFLYDNLSRSQAALLIPIATLSGVGKMETTERQSNTFLFHCPKWNFLRQNMWATMGSRYGDV